MDVDQFLARVVAPGNFSVVCWKNPTGGGMFTRFFPVDRRGEAPGLLRWAADTKHAAADAYFAVASFAAARADGTDKQGRPKYKGERTQENVQSLKAFWIDIDVKRDGDKKGTNVYKDRTEAILWLKHFLQVTDMPKPNLWVDSGYGFHLYWVLEDPMTRAEWQPYADALAHALTASGFKCETGISSDAARILRPPETLNRKADPPVPVVALSKHSAGDYPNQLIFDKLQPYVSVARPTVGPTSSAAALAGGAPAQVLAGQQGQMAAAVQANMPATSRAHLFANIATSCGQVMASLAAGGNGDPYQLWYLGFLSLAHHCTDGADFVHQISQGDPRYDRAQTDAMVAQIAKEKTTKDTGPPRCMSFDQWRPGICDKCPHFRKITSPWNLGADDGGADQMVAIQAQIDTRAGVITTLPSEMPPELALKLINQSFFFAHNWGGEPRIGHVTPDGVRAITDDHFCKMFANRYVLEPRMNDAGKQVGVNRVPLGKWWLAHPRRREYDQVLYDPEGTRSRAEERVYNLWTGFAKTSRRGCWSGMARHIFNIICKRNRAEWRYMIRWRAHAVQHPGTAPGTVPVLKSEAEGTGKSSVLEWMARMFGDHALMLSTPDDLIGEFNDHLESRSLIGLNEPAFPGDHRAAGKLKSMITESAWLLNGKFRAARRVPNIAHIMLTTNASWAVPAGNRARRFFVLSVDERRAGDHAYFKALWDEANNGGIEAMLHVLLRVDLAGFDLLDVPRTQALRLQQMRSASTMTQWAADAAVSRVLIPASSGTSTIIGDGFNASHSSPTLYGAYQQWTVSMKYRPESHVEFGRWLGRCGFSRTKVNGTSTYDIPDPKAFAAKVFRQAGIV